MFKGGDLLEYVYAYTHPNYGFVYIGRTCNLSSRIASHDVSSHDNIKADNKQLLNESSVYYIELNNKAESICVEAYLINKHKPLLNKSLSYDDNKAAIEMKLPEFKKYPDDLRKRAKKVGVDYLKLVDSIMQHEFHFKRDYDEVETRFIEKKIMLDEAFSAELAIDKQLRSMKDTLERKRLSAALLKSTVNSIGSYSNIAYKVEDVKYFLSHTDIPVKFYGGSYAKNGEPIYDDYVMFKKGDDIVVEENGTDVTKSIGINILLDLIRFVPDIDISSAFQVLVTKRKTEIESDTYGESVTLGEILASNGHVKGKSFVSEDFRFVVYIDEGYISTICDAREKVPFWRDERDNTVKVDFDWRSKIWPVDSDYAYAGGNEYMDLDALEWIKTNSGVNIFYSYDKVQDARNEIRYLDDIEQRIAAYNEKIA